MANVNQTSTAAPVQLSPDPILVRQSRPFRDTVVRLLHNRSAIVGLFILTILLLMAVFAPVFATHDPLQTMIGVPGEVPPLPRKAPCIPAFGCEEPLHILGLDLNARDLYSRIIYGSQISLFLGVVIVSFASLTGSMLGLISGYFGGWVDNIIMRTMDVLLAFPSLLLAIAIVTIRGPGLQNALIAIGIVAIPVYARLMRSSVLTLKEQEFVTAVRALGASPVRIMFRHILINALTPIMVQATLGIGTAVIEAAALSFLGLGAQPPTPEWGQMLAEARNYVFSAPHLVFFPGIAITLTVLGFNLLGDGLRDTLDPRLKGV